MKAPNGKSTNLTEKQWLQVRTKAFKDWFGDWTKVIPKTVFKKGDIISIGGSNFTVSRVEKDSNYNVPIIYVKESLQTRKGGFIPSLNAVIVSEINTDEETIKHELVHSKEYNVDTSSLNNLYEKVKQTITEDSFINGVVTNNFRKNIHEFIADALTKSTFRNALKKEGILDEVEAAINNVIEKTPKDDVSKVVDENGEPLVVYHGSDYKDDATIIGDWSKNVLPYATYFAPYQGYANFKHVYFAFLNIKNPIYSDELLTEEAIQDEDVFKKFIIDRGYDGAISGTQIELYKTPSNATKAREIVVVNPNQIKSATDNIGTFSTTNNDIRYSSITEQPIKVPSITSFAERLQVQQQSKFASLVARGEISTSCR